MGKLGQNANDVTSNAHSGVLVRRWCLLTGVRSFISIAGHRTGGSCAFTDIEQVSNQWTTCTYIGHSNVERKLSKHSAILPDCSRGTHTVSCRR